MTDKKISIRQFRCPDELWAKLEAYAREEEWPIDTLIVGAIRTLVNSPPPRLLAPLPMPCLIMGPRFPKVDPALAHATGQLVVWSAGVDHLVQKQRFVIGSDPTCDLRLGGTEVEPKHALIELVDGAHHIVDLGSTAGVVCNGARVTRKRIDTGDEIMIGRHRLVFRHV